ncbi:MAG TPA: pyridoxamine 5'-phosphate oxidase [Methylibium sp.]|uniref:pyridoxamine 5'-phosphate oxidase n=1 Tax=Methylibium sp. TaxID=2067992 RepID=UPI002DC00FCE|nr:pyridoxamine 5'-phosphate oxidase [Methylibium sp.]HEU4457551.1 pyridoxamine 5'-phosphate oxidase [Methylibium sp.]
MTATPSPPPLADLRKSYELGALDEADAAADPMQQFQRWFDEARSAQVLEPNAMTLATVGADGRPSTRVVLVKGLDARGLVWYTNYESRKGRELEAHPWAALQFHWVAMERQVRIEGRVEKSDPDEADRYHASRPLASRIGAWASPQSRVIASRQVLEELTAEAQARFASEPPRPPHWGGYRLVPDRWEFWQGRRSRLHDRLRYTAQPDGHWLRERLAP